MSMTLTLPLPALPQEAKVSSAAAIITAARMRLNVFFMVYSLVFIREWIFIFDERIILHNYSSVKGFSEYFLILLYIH